MMTAMTIGAKGPAGGGGNPLPAMAGTGAAGLDFSALMGATMAEAAPDGIAPASMPVSIAAEVPVAAQDVASAVAPLIGNNVAPPSILVVPPAADTAQIAGKGEAPVAVIAPPVRKGIAPPSILVLPEAAETTPPVPAMMPVAPMPNDHDVAQAPVAFSTEADPHSRAGSVFAAGEDAADGDADHDSIEDDDASEILAASVPTDGTAVPIDLLAAAQIMAPAPVTPVRKPPAEAVRREPVAETVVPAGSAGATQMVVPTPAVAANAVPADGVKAERVALPSAEGAAVPFRTADPVGRGRTASGDPAAPQAAVGTPMQSGMPQAVPVPQAKPTALVEATRPGSNTAPVASITAPAGAVAVAAAVQAAPIAHVESVAMPPAMAMMHDVSALLAQAAPVTAQPNVAQPVQGAVPAPAAVVASSAGVSFEPAVPAKRRTDNVGDGAAVSAPLDPALSVTATIAPVAIVAARDGMQPQAPALPDPAKAITSEAAVAFHVDAARHGQELDQVARDIVATGGEGAKLSFKLDSHRLGSVGVEMMRHEAGLHVRLEAGDAAVRDLIADQQRQLVADARAVGVRIAETSVEAPRREDVPAQQQQGGTTARNDPASGQTANGQSMNGQAGGQRGSGQQAQAAPGWTQAGRGTGTGAGTRTERPAATPRELYA